MVFILFRVFLVYVSRFVCFGCSVDENAYETMLRSSVFTVIYVGTQTEQAKRYPTHSHCINFRANVSARTQYTNTNTIKQNQMKSCCIQFPKGYDRKISTRNMLAK